MGIENSVFFIIGTPRSGTNHLCSLLGSHPKIACHNEIFHPDEVAAYLSEGSPNLDRRKRNRGPRKFLQELFRETEALYPQRDVFGAKLILSAQQISLGLEPVLDHPGARIILMDRANRLAGYSSETLALKTGVWLSSSRPEKRERVAFDAGAYEAYAAFLDEETAHVKAEVAERGIPSIAVDYNDLMDPATLVQVQDFLGCQRADMTSNIVKLNPGRLIERFTNPDEVVAYFTERGREAWLDE